MFWKLLLFFRQQNIIVFGYPLKNQFFFLFSVHLQFFARWKAMCPLLEFIRSLFFPSFLEELSLSKDSCQCDVHHTHGKNVAFGRICFHCTFSPWKYDHIILAHCDVHFRVYFSGNQSWSPNCFHIFCRFQFCWWSRVPTTSQFLKYVFLLRLYGVYFRRYFHESHCLEHFRSEKDHNSE